MRFPTDLPDDFILNFAKIRGEKREPFFLMKSNDFTCAGCRSKIRQSLSKVDENAMYW